MNRNFIFLLLLLSASACNNKHPTCTLKVTFDCYPTSLFDTLSTVLLSNSYRDIGGIEKSNLFESLFAKRILLKNIGRDSAPCFYISNVEKRSYAYLYIETKLDGANWYGFKRNLDFSDISGDTAEITLCIEPETRFSE